MHIKDIFMEGNKVTKNRIYDKVQKYIKITELKAKRNRD